MTAQLQEGVPGENYSCQNMMRQAGLNDSEAIIGVPGMWWSPGESNPRSAITHVLTKGVQNLLKRLGVPIVPTGVYGANTHQALVQKLGPAYTSCAWVQIYGDLLNATKGKSLTIPWKNDAVYEKEETLMGYESQGAADPSVFASLQAQINRYAKALGFAPVAVDGNIGPATATAAGMAATWVSNFSSMDVSVLAVAAAPTPAIVQVNASGLYAALKKNADAQGWPAAGSSGGGGGGGAMATIPGSSVPYASPGVFGDVNPVVVVGGGAFLLWLLFGKKGLMKKGRR